MTTILIIILSTSSGITTDHIEFDTHSACVVAQNVIVTAINKNSSLIKFGIAKCVSK